MRSAARLLSFTTHASLVLGCVATLLMMLHVCADIVARQFTIWRVPGTLETVTYVYMVMIAFLPLAMVQARRQQISVELFVELIPPRVLALLDGVVGLIGTGFLMVMTWFSLGLAWSQTLIWEAAPSMTAPVPIWPIRWLLVLSWTLVCIHLAVQTIESLTLAWSGRPTARSASNGGEAALPAVRDA